MEKLSRYLWKHLVLDFDGEVTLERIGAMLASDETPASRVLREKLAKEDGPDQFLIALADVLRESLADGVTAETVEAEIRAYVEA